LESVPGADPDDQHAAAAPARGQNWLRLPTRWLLRSRGQGACRGWAQPEGKPVELLMDRLQDSGIRFVDMDLDVAGIPDGAARFQRRNAQGIDLQRDARALVTPGG